MDKQHVLRLVKEVQSIPYRWPSLPDADTARRLGTGTCASKHALLAEELEKVGIESHPLFVVGKLLPASLASHPDLRGAADLLEVHECLTLLTPWAGPLLVDVTWDPPLVRAGLPGDCDWDGNKDMPLAIDVSGPSWSVSREGLRQSKEALRLRLYQPGERETRDAALTRMMALFDEARQGKLRF